MEVQSGKVSPSVAGIPWRSMKRFVGFFRNTCDFLCDINGEDRAEHVFKLPEGLGD